MMDDSAGKVEGMMHVAGGIDGVLVDLLRHEEILGAVAVSVEGLIIGSAGVETADAELAGALGAALVGSTERTVRQMGAGDTGLVSIATADGMIHLRPGAEFALIVFSDDVDSLAVSQACQSAVAHIESLLSPVA